MQNPNPTNPYKSNYYAKLLILGWFIIGFPTCHSRGLCGIDSFLGMIVAQGRFCREDELEPVGTISYLKPSCDSSFSGYQDHCCPKWAILNLRRCGGATGLHACFVLEMNGYPMSHEVNLLLAQSMGFGTSFSTRQLPRSRWHTPYPLVI